MHKSAHVELPCLSRNGFPIERQNDGSLRIRISVCRSEHCRFRLFADLGLQADGKGLFLMPESDVSTEAEARAYLAAWRFFALQFLAEKQLWADALGH